MCAKVIDSVRKQDGRLLLASGNSDGFDGRMGVTKEGNQEWGSYRGMTGEVYVRTR